MEIHIGDRVADVTLVSKEGNKVQMCIRDSGRMVKTINRKHNQLNIFI